MPDNPSPIRILFLEDTPADAELAQYALRKEGLPFTAVCVDSRPAFLAALDSFRPDLVISDYNLPQFTGLQALELSIQRDPGLPFVLLTSTKNEEVAVACMKAGATDYVLKDRLARLPFAVKEALRQKDARLAQEASECALRDSEARFRSYIEHAPLGIFVTDGQGRYLEANPAGLKLLQYEAGLLRSMSIPDVVSAEPVFDSCEIDITNRVME